MKRRREQFTGPYPGYDHAQAVREMYCCVSAAPPPCDPHHVKSRGAGGKWFDMVPLSPEMHRFVHQVGCQTFEAMYGVDLRAVADRLAAQARERAA